MRWGMGREHTWMHTVVMEEGEERKEVGKEGGGRRQEERRV